MSMAILRHHWTVFRPHASPRHRRPRQPHLHMQSLHTARASPNLWYPLVTPHPQVLDRVLVHGSGDSWWAVLSGRAKLGKMAAERGNPVGGVAVLGWQFCSSWLAGGLVRTAHQVPCTR